MTLLCCHAFYSRNIVSNGEVLVLIADIIWNRTILWACSRSSMRHLNAIASGKHLVKVQIQIELMHRRVVLPSSASTTSTSPKSSWFISMTGCHVCDIFGILHHAGLHETYIVLCDATLLTQSDVSQ